MPLKQKHPPTLKSPRPNLKNHAAGTPEKIAEIIMSGVMSGQFVPGQRLIEADITQLLGISRGSLREALKYLAAIGVVTLHRHRGAHVSTMDHKMATDLLEVVEPMCRLAARLAAKARPDSKQIAHLRQFVSDIQNYSEAGDQAGCIRSKRRFWEALMAMGGNVEIRRMLPLDRVGLYQIMEWMQTPRQKRRQAKGYGLITDAVAAADVAQADRAVIRHFANGARKTLAELATAGS